MQQQIDKISYAAWWLFWIIIQVIILHRLNINWLTALIDSMITNVLLVFASIVTQNTYKFYQTGRGNRLYRLASSLLLSAITVFAIQYFLTLIFNDDVHYLKFLDASIPIRFAYVLLMIAFITVVSWLSHYVHQQTDNAKRKAESELLLRDSELSKLHLQLQPHFLFNSLNSISALAGSRPDEARKMIQQLSDFFRGTLKSDSKQLVSFESELNHLQLYLDIEKVRFGHRLEIVIDCDAETLQLRIPTLILQPIVENAIKFGLYDMIGSVQINVNAKTENSNLIVTIENPFDAATSKPKTGTGFGLSSIERRLYLLYAQSNLLSTQQNNLTFITQIKIPQLK